MSEPLYRIKPLVWEGSTADSFCAEAMGGWYIIVVNYTNGHCAWRWRGSHDRHTNSLEAAKAACEAHYRERLMEGLEVVK